MAPHAMFPRMGSYLGNGEATDWLCLREASCWVGFGGRPWGVWGGLQPAARGTGLNKGKEPGMWVLWWLRRGGGAQWGCCSTKGRGPAGPGLQG